MHAARCCTARCCTTRCCTTRCCTLLLDTARCTQVTKAVEEITREELIAVGEEPGRNYRRAVVFYMDQGKSGEASFQPPAPCTSSSARAPAAAVVAAGLEADWS